MSTRRRARSSGERRHSPRTISTRPGRRPRREPSLHGGRFCPARTDGGSRISGATSVTSSCVRSNAYASRRLLADELGAYPSPESEAVYLEILRSSAGGSDSEIERLATDGRRPESPPQNDEPPRRGRGKVAPVIAGALLVGGKCDDCGATLPQYSKFCPECGHAVEATPSPATYTPGHLRNQILAIRSAIEGERKQVSVLFCDIVRSPELAAQAGPEEYHRVVDRFFALALAEVHRYEGTVKQFLGDGFMALFGG